MIEYTNTYHKLKMNVYFYNINVTEICFEFTIPVDLQMPVLKNVKVGLVSGEFGHLWCKPLKLQCFGHNTAQHLYTDDKKHYFFRVLSNCSSLDYGVQQYIYDPRRMCIGTSIKGLILPLKCK